MTDDRRYGDREVGLILKRVAELHEEGADGTDARSMTRTEIEQVVNELGISKALVARAASEVSVMDVRNRSVWWLGGKTDLLFEQSIDGAVDDATLTLMLEVLRRSLGDPGTLKMEGSVRIWSTDQSSRRVNLSVVDHGETTTLRLEERMPVDSRTTVGFGTGAGSIAGFMTVIPLKVLLVKSMMLLAWGPFIAVGATLGWLGGRALWKRRSAGREQQLRRAFAEILALADAGPKALPPA